MLYSLNASTVKDCAVDRLWGKARFSDLTGGRPGRRSTPGQRYRSLNWRSGLQLGCVAQPVWLPDAETTKQGRHGVGATDRFTDEADFSTMVVERVAEI